MLAEKIGGTSVTYHPPGLWEMQWASKIGKGHGDVLSSPQLYTFWKTNRPPRAGSLRAAEEMSAYAKRQSTSTPLQALSF